MPEVTSEQKLTSDVGIAQRYDISRSGVWLWVKKGILPKPIRISPGCTRFDIEACDEAISYKAQAA